MTQDKCCSVVSLGADDATYIERDTSRLWVGLQLPSGRVWQPSLVFGSHVHPCRGIVRMGTHFARDFT